MITAGYQTVFIELWTDYLTLNQNNRNLSP